MSADDARRIHDRDQRSEAYRELAEDVGVYAVEMLKAGLDLEHALDLVRSFQTSLMIERGLITITPEDHPDGQ